MEITYKLIQPLIQSETANNYSIECAFKASNSAKIVRSSASIKRNREGINEVQNIVKDNALYYVNSMMRSLVRNVFGGGFIGSTGSRITERVAHNNMRTFRNTPGEKRAAVVEAFRRVASQFHYDKKNKNWLHVDSLSDFSAKVIETPVGGQYEKEIQARMLLELASIDGVGSKEQEYLREQIPDSKQRRDISISEPLSKTELQETSAKSRESMFMLAAALVLVDHKISEREKTRLLEFANYFEFTPQKVNDLLLVAKKFILEQSIMTPNISRQELFQIADTIKLDREEAERVLIGMRKRNYM